MRWLQAILVTCIHVLRMPVIFQELMVTLLLFQLTLIMGGAGLVLSPGIKEVFRKVLICIRTDCRWEPWSLLHWPSVLGSRLEASLESIVDIWLDVSFCCEDVYVLKVSLRQILTLQSIVAIWKIRVLSSHLSHSIEGILVLQAFTYTLYHVSHRSGLDNLRRVDDFRLVKVFERTIQSYAWARSLVGKEPTWRGHGALG